MIKKEHTLWTEAFRPGTLDGYIGNEQIIDKVKIFLESKDVPHLLFYGPAGTGKTTLAKIISNTIAPTQTMYINASDENSVDVVRDKIKRFASTVSFGGLKLVILDEADFLTPNGQAALRNLMETYSNTTRFILTCNYVEKIIDPIQSRCQVYGITPPSKQDVAIRLASVMDSKGIEYKPEDVVSIIHASYPDIRRAINSAQGHVVGNKLSLDKVSIIQSNYMTEVLEALKSKRGTKDKFQEIRQIIADSKVRDFQPLYTFLYENLDEFAAGHLAPVILIIADSQFQDAHVIDHEINVMSMFVKLISEI